jgi:hypothetical protein
VAPRRRRALIACSFLALCAFVASGRTVAFDSRSQLTEAAHFCATGHIAARHKLTGDFVPKNFQKGAGVWYDANDIGGTLLVLPSACASALFGQKNPHHTTGLVTGAKVGASLTFALVGGIGVALLFLTLARLIGDRRAFWWTVAFLFATAYLAYVRGIWNVLPAAAAISGLMYAIGLQFPEGTLPRISGADPPSAPPASEAPAARHPMRVLCGAAVAVGFACLCRYSLGPFLIPAATLALWPTIRRVTTRDRLLVVGLLLLILAPDLWYNQLRTGHFWVPGEASPQWEPLHITGSYLFSTLGMFFGIQRGLLFYAPVCLLGYVGVLALIWRTRGFERIAWASALACTVAYATTVVLLHNWYVYGWGPRYLVPLLPILFVATVVACETHVIPRAAAYVAVGFGLVTQAPVAFTNWHALLAVVGVNNRAPNGITGLWNSFVHGLTTGKSFGGTKSPRTLQVPDTWWWHAIGTHLPGLIGLVITAAGLAVMLSYGARRAREAPESLHLAPAEV